MIEDVTPKRCERCKRPFRFWAGGDTRAEIDPDICTSCEEEVIRACDEHVDMDTPTVVSHMNSKADWPHEP